LHFLSSKFKIQNSKLKIKIQNYQTPDNAAIDCCERSIIYPIITTLASPKQHYEWGRKFYKLKIENCKLKIALVASGDMSHCLKPDGPYGFHEDGPKFDKAFQKYLIKKDIPNLLKLDEMFPEAGECGLRSFSFLLGILEANSMGSGQVWQPEILSYEGPFGVGYLVVNLKIK